MFLFGEQGEIARENEHAEIRLDDRARDKRENKWLCVCVCVLQGSSEPILGSVDWQTHSQSTAIYHREKDVKGK